ncbi:MAG: TonB-dependent receptor, partial [Bacteroidia bacterium]|nr:TonB-dependent receptor [Bacteroidia bacterium]
RSEFKDKNNEYSPSAWDNKHLLNITAGKKLKKNWELGLKFRLLGGAPYTPYDIARSSQKDIWDIYGFGILDYDQLNTKRNDVFHSMDLRIDKRWYFTKWSLNTYLDLENIYNFELTGQPYFTVLMDADGNPIEDPNNTDAYLNSTIENTTGTIIPSIGIMLEF